MKSDFKSCKFINFTINIRIHTRKYTIHFAEYNGIYQLNWHKYKIELTPKIQITRFLTKQTELQPSDIVDDTNNSTNCKFFRMKQRKSQKKKSIQSKFSTFDAWTWTEWCFECLEKHPFFSVVHRCRDIFVLSLSSVFCLVHSHTLPTFALYA